MPSVPPPRSLLIKPASGDCNLHCAYCFYHDRESDPYRETRHPRMSAEVLDVLIRQGMALDRRQATFGWQGGEPTLAGLDFFRQAVALQQRYGEAGQAVSNGLQTNGLLLNAEWARFLRQYNFLLGVSLDGPAVYHDAYRQYASGGATHARVIESLHLLRQYHVEFNVLSVVNRITSNHGREIFNYLAGEGFGFLQFIPCVEADPLTGQMADFSVQSEQYGTFLCEMFDLWYNQGNPQVSIRDFEAILEVYVGQEAPLCCYQEQCGSYLVVEYNGDLYPCDFMVRDDTYIGNLTKMTLPQAFASASLQRFKTLKAAPRFECQVCAWLPLCHQGCYRLVNVDGSKQHYLCRGYQQFFAHSREGFLKLRDRVLLSQGQDPSRAAPTPSLNVGRNDPCPCGSGRKYKQCCGRVSA
jgi:uncharacterized protein